jgi:hypothetical protein
MRLTEDQQIRDLTSKIRYIADGTKRVNNIARENIMKGKTKFKIDPGTKRIMAEVDLMENGKTIGTATFWLVNARSPAEFETNSRMLLKYIDEMNKTMDYHIEEAVKVQFNHGKR